MTIIELLSDNKPHLTKEQIELLEKPSWASVMSSRELIELGWKMAIRHLREKAGIR
jgi:hypothetical protein